MKYQRSEIFLGIIFLAGCIDGSNVTRADAKKIIESTPIKGKNAVPINKEFMECLLKSKQVQHWLAQFSPSGSGKRYIAKADYSIFSGTGLVSLTQPIHFKNVTVTGITEAQNQNNQTLKQVDFTADYDFGSIAIDGAIPPCFVEKWFVTAKGSLTKYDDGWRLTYTNIELQEEPLN